MPRESIAEKKLRAAKILEGLRRAYPTAHCELNFSNPLELLVATILSAQSTDKQVNVVTVDLFKKYRRARDFAEADLEELQRDIQRIGFFRNKARSIKGCCQKLVERYDGQVPRTMEELVELDGVGRKTANVVLGNAFHANVGVVVDTHVARLAGRLGFTRQDDPKKIELDLMKLVPRELWTLFSHWLIWHGRRRCFARWPDCPNCEVASLCPSCARIG
jgi:endonuclease III